MKKNLGRDTFTFRTDTVSDSLVDLARRLEGGATLVTRILVLAQILH